MKGFRDFLLRGNLIDMAVAFIMAASFNTVVTTFTALVMNVIGLLGGTPDFSSVTVGGVNIGEFITALVSFVIMGAVVYFGIVRPYERLRTMFGTKEEEKPAGPSTEDLLTEIRDLLAKK